MKEKSIELFTIDERLERLETGISNYATEGNGKKLSDGELGYVYEYAVHWIKSRNNVSEVMNYILGRSETKPEDNSEIVDKYRKELIRQGKTRTKISALEQRAYTLAMKAVEGGFESEELK